MMEKYGTDLSELPVDDDQTKQIEALVKKKKDARIIYVVPKNKKEAAELIEILEKLGQ